MADNLPLIVALLTILCITYVYHARTSGSSHPVNSPTAVPHLIPWFGSFFAISRDPVKFLKKCFSQHGKFYKITISGKTVVVIADADAITFISRDPNNSLDHKIVFTNIMRAIGDMGASTDFIMDLMDSKIFPIVAKAFSPGSMSEVTAELDVLLSRELKALYLPNSRSKSLNLSEVIGRCIYNAGTRALFGSTFPLDSYYDFVELDLHLPQLLTGLPFIAQRGRRARRHMLSTLEKYIEAWWDSDGTEDIPDASPTLMLSLIELKASQVNRRAAAGAILVFLWGFHSNTWYMIFWLMTHLVVDKASVGRMVADIDIFRSKRSLDELDDPNRTPPLLESALQETLRWATTSTTARYATEDTTVVVEGVPVPIAKGEWILGDTRGVHNNPEIYEEPAKFSIDRYLDNNDHVKSPPKPSPWGRGKHMCPGRHVAVHVIRRFVVELLSVYEVAPANLEGRSQAVPSISPRYFMGHLKSTQDFPITLLRRA